MERLPNLGPSSHPRIEIVCPFPVQGRSRPLLVNRCPHVAPQRLVYVLVQGALLPMSSTLRSAVVCRMVCRLQALAEAKRRRVDVPSRGIRGAAGIWRIWAGGVGEATALVPVLASCDLNLRGRSGVEKRTIVDGIGDVYVDRCMA